MTVTAAGAPGPVSRAGEAPILGRYRVQQCLAVGGSAEVWRAVDEQTGRPVAVKRPRPHLLAEPGARERLIAEARAVAGLAHPGIVRVLDIDPSPHPSIIFELVEGESLSVRLERTGTVPPRTAARIARDLAGSLYHAHVHGVIHRDVKPGNVLLGGDGSPMLIDFGIARVLADAAARRTETGMVMGTLSYMAPEQLAGEALTPRTDLYGLGAVLYQMLTGRPPHPAEWPAALLEAQAGEPPEAEGIDPALRSVVRACLQPRAVDRPRHAGVVAAALDAWLQGDNEPARALDGVPRPAPGAAGARPAADQATALREAAPRRPPPPRRAMPIRRRVALAAIAGASVLLGAALANLAGPGSTNRAEALAPSVVPSPASVPSWAVTLADAYTGSCNGDPFAMGTTPAQLASMDEAVARRYVDALVTQCTSDAASATDQAAGGNPAHGHGNGHGSGHGHD